MEQEQATLDIKRGPLFPISFRFVAVLLIIAAVALFLSYPLASVILLLVSLGILSAQEGVEFNQAQRTYREYYAFFFIKSGKPYSYQGVEKVFMNSGQVSERMYTAHTTSSAVFTNREYRGFVKFDDGTKVLIARGKKKSSIEEKLQQVSNYLNAVVVDHSY